MRTMELGVSGLRVPPVAVGCMRLAGIAGKKAEEFVKTAIDLGLNFFDHADIYGGGSCESVFADAAGMNDDVREKIFIQSKCGIRKGMYDFSKEHILEAVDGSLKRLRTDYLDVLLLHRPDTLMEPEEVAEAFDQLKSSGKVLHFGVSNQNPGQMELLSKYLNQPIIADQMQFGPAHTGMIDSGLNVNTMFDAAAVRDGGVLEYCRLKDITIQAWSPFQYGFFEGVFLGSEKYAELSKVIAELAEKYGVTDNGIITAWVLRHPANIMMISGTMNAGRLAEIAAGTEVTLTREDWYRMYLAAGNRLP